MLRPGYENTRGWLMEPDRPTSMDAYLNAERRRKLSADPDPKIIQQLIETGKAEVKHEG